MTHQPVVSTLTAVAALHTERLTAHVTAVSPAHYGGGLVDARLAAPSLFRRKPRAVQVALHWVAQLNVHVLTSTCTHSQSFIINNVPVHVHVPSCMCMYTSIRMKAAVDSSNNVWVNGKETAKMAEESWLAHTPPQTAI